MDSIKKQQLMTDIDKIDKLLSQDHKELEWQYSEDKSEVELIYWQDIPEDISNSFISMEVDYFNKEVDYVHSEYYNDGFQQDIRTKEINILDEDADFDKSDVIVCFMEMWHDDIRNITFSKIEE